MSFKLNTEKDWESYYDAQTLVSAEKIKSDDIRLAKAQAMAEEMLDEKEDEKSYLKSVAKIKAKK